MKLTERHKAIIEIVKNFEPITDKVKSLLSVEYKSTFISLSFDLIVTVTVLLLMFSSGNSETTGASEGTFTSAAFPSLSITPNNPLTSYT